MRTAFINALTELAERDPQTVLIVGDLGFGVVDKFAKRFPKQFLNAGVAEQNMTGIAAGLALSGKTVFTYSIANFPVLRCFEQIRNDVCYHEANVKIVAVGGGFSYGSLGPSHHATEDLAVTRSLPNMIVVAPGDPVEARLAVHAIAAHNGPCYLRLGRAGERRIHAENVAFKLGQAIEVRPGTDLALISTGAMLETALLAAERLEREAVSVRVISMHTVRPLDAEAVLAAAEDCGAIVTLEEHTVTGGLGSAVAEVLAESGRQVSFKRIGIPSTFCKHVGKQEYLRDKYGLSEIGVCDSIRSFLLNRVKPDSTSNHSTPSRSTPSNNTLTHTLR